MWNRFLLKCVLLALPIPAMVALYCLPQARYFPAPRLTSNLAVNEKLAFARKHFPDGADILAIGSSMTLNNVHSPSVLEHFGPVRFLNAGAWGIGASEIAVIGPILVRQLRPHTVIVSTNLMDFATYPNILAHDSLSMARSFNEPGVAGYLRHWNAPYYLREMGINRIRFNDAANYEYLGYDANGGAQLSLRPEQINQTRFNLPPTPAKELSGERYEAFGRFARELHQRGIRLIVWESAYRDGLRNPKNDEVQQRHVERLRSIIGPLGGVLVDANQRSWDDSLFVDSSHLGPEGARAYTRYCTEQLGQPEPPDQNR